MQSLIKKLIGLLTIGSICLLLLVFSELQAQQTATPPSTGAPSSALTIKDLESRRMTIKNMTDIDASVKTDSLKYIDQAIAYSAVSYTHLRAHETLTPIA